MSSEIVRQNQQTADAVSSSATSVYYILKSPKIKDDSKGFLVILYSNCYFSDRHDIRGVFCENATLLQCEAVLFFAENPGCTAPGQPSAAGSGEFLGLLRCRN